EKLSYHHDALRLTFKEEGKQYYNKSIIVPEIKTLNVSEMSHDLLTKWQSEFDIKTGPLWQVGYIEGFKDGSARIYLAIHHLIEDAVSLRILKEDIKSLYEGNKLPEKTSSYRQWSDAVKQFAIDNIEERGFWKANIKEQPDYSKLKVLKENVSYKQIKLDKETTNLLLYKANNAYHTEINDLLLTSLAYSLRTWHNCDTSYITLEGHGRENIKDTIDLNRTIGWFTTMYPVKLTLGNDFEESIKNIKEDIRKIPNKGIGYSAIKYYTDNNELKKHKLPEILFNYLGQFDSKDEGDYQFTGEFAGLGVDVTNIDNNILEINGMTIEGEISFTVSGRLIDNDLDDLSQSLKRSLENITKHCIEKIENNEIKYTPSDFKTVKVSRILLDKLQKEYDIQEICPANSLQQGFIYHALSYPNDDAYRVQVIFDYHNRLDIEKLKKAWELTVKRYPVLRACFNWEEELVQIIDKKAHINWFEHDISHEQDKDIALKDIQEKDRKEGFDLTKPGLFKLHLIKHGENHYTFIKSEHHSILDGWSFPIELKCAHEYYRKLTNNEEIEIKEETAYIESQKYFYENRKEVEKYWEHKIKQIETINDINSLLSRNAELDNIKSLDNFSEHIAVIDKTLYKDLKKLVREEGITINVILQFAWHKIIQTYTKDLQTIVGTTISGRDIPIDDLQVFQLLFLIYQLRVQVFL
ncbi:MAG: gramicidin biosynthesis protein, partial [Desulfobacterales bacterium]|nr:gramicidin biosynthesis protein [Desulfobacterales bacterium]